jgi:hypothetical protein
MPGFLENCVVTNLSDKPGLLQITGVCPRCSKLWKLCISEQSTERWKSGELLQDVLPNLSDDKREQLINGICNGCFNELSKE